MSRSERLALKDKVALEKDRLWKRTGWQARLYRENAPRHGSMGLTAMEPNAAGFLADADRFHSDVSGEEYLSRMKKYVKRTLPLLLATVLLLHHSCYSNYVQ